MLSKQNKNRTKPCVFLGASQTLIGMPYAVMVALF